MRSIKNVNVLSLNVAHMARLTRLEKMVWLFVTDSVFSFRVWPPRWGFDIPLGIRMVSLFLGLH